MAGFLEVETQDPSLAAFQCQCGQVIKKRKDAFVPGLHVLICLACGDRSSEIQLMSGEVKAVTAESHRDGADG